MKQREGEGAITLELMGPGTRKVWHNFRLILSFYGSDDSITYKLLIEIQKHETMSGILELRKTIRVLLCLSSVNVLELELWSKTE